MATPNVGHRRRERAPKPLSVPLAAMLIGSMLVIVGLVDRAQLNLAGLGLILFFWGSASATVLLISRRRRAARGAGPRR